MARLEDEHEQRRAARIKFSRTDRVEIAYKFLSHLNEFQCDRVFDGNVLNLSKGGALFEGEVPGSDWLPQLGQGHVLIGVNVMIPGDRPIKALSVLRWTRPLRVPGTENPVYELGVEFEQIEPEHRSRLSRFLIRHQLETRKFRRAEILEQEGY